MSEASNMVKVALVGDDGDTETLWAELLPSGLLRLDNAPFFFYGASAGDLLEATKDPDHPAFYHFVRVVERSGNYTIRIYAEEGNIASADFKPILDRLKSMGCAYEGFAPNLLSVTIHHGQNVDEVITYLNNQGLTWEYGNPTYNELFGDTD